MTYLGDETNLATLVEKAYDVAPRKNEFLDAVTSHGTVLMYCADLQYLEGFKNCLVAHKPEVDFWSFTVATSIGTRHVLVVDPTGLKTHIEGLLAEYFKRDKPQSEKTLVKMLSMRLNKLEAVSKEYIQNRIRRMSHVQTMIQGATDPETRKAWEDQLETVGPECPPWPDSSVSAFRRWCLDHPVVGRWENFKKYLIQVNTLIMREDMTDEIVKQALNQMHVQEVMET